MEEGYGMYRGKQLIMFFGSWASRQTVQSIADEYVKAGIIKGTLEVKRVKVFESPMEG